MSIASSDELIVKAEIKAVLFEQAFIELGREFLRQNPKGFGACVQPLIEKINAFSVNGFMPPPASLAASFEIKRAQQEGQSDAIEAVQIAFGRILKSGRAR